MEERRDFYVYGLFRKSDDSVFYIGKGTGDRYKKTDCKGRSKETQHIVKTEEVYSKILFSNLTNKEALNKESELIQKYGKSLTNKVKKTKVKDLDFDYFNNLVYVDDSSSSGLRWKIKTGKIRIGDEVGTRDKSGRWIMSSNNKKYLIHRIVWLLVNGCVPEDLYIDHIDGNTSNNRISNLRLVEPKINSRNRTYRPEVNKSTGLFGITLDFNKKEIYKGKVTYRDYVVAAYRLLDGKVISKYFNLANFNNLEEAISFAKDYLDTELSVLKSKGIILYSDRHLGK